MAYWSFFEGPVLKVTLVLIVAAVYEIQCLNMLPEETLPVLNCTGGAYVNVIQVQNHQQRFDVKLKNNFKYLQISMKINNCYSHSIFRGNRFVTGSILNVSHTEITVPMDVSYKRMQGRHAYHVTIGGEKQIIFSEDINTGESCGKCRGFKVKGVGAFICPHAQKDNKISSNSLINHHPEVISNSYTIENENRGFGSINTVNTNENIPEAKSDMFDKEKSPNDDEISRVLHKLHLWTNEAYVVVVCLTLTVYLMVMIAKACRKRMYYNSLDNRDFSDVPGNSP